MLHMPSHNMGVAAGIAWKAAGQEHFNLGDIKREENEDSPRYKFMLDILNLAEPLDIFFPSSFFEGFARAYSDKPYFVQ